MEPGNAKGFVGLASLLWDLGRKDEALDLYRKGLALHPGIPQAWLTVTWMLVDAGRIDEAEETARRGLTAHPNFAPLRIPISACSERRGDLDGARRELEEAVRADPRLWAAWGELAQILLTEGRPGRRAQCRRAMRVGRSGRPPRTHRPWACACRARTHI